MLNWTQQFSIFLFLDSNGYDDRYGHYECLVAAGSHATCTGLDAMQHWHDTNKDWLFGHICYDYKNELEPKLSSRHPIATGWGDDPLHFFQPAVVCYISKDKTTLTIESLGDTPLAIYDAILATDDTNNASLPRLQFQQVIDKQPYLTTIDALRRHIADGDCYEINFCNEGICNDADVQPLAVFNALNTISPAPFAAFYRSGDRYMMCASPERYITRNGSTLLSQPIKGTARRGTDAISDQAAKNNLYNSIKDRAENVMIVDLVRNDLARSCKVGSVSVDELFGIYSFPQVHQMISTISGRLDEATPFTNAIRYSFPMGSMTGAPKIKVMELIDRYEHSRRELFAGTVGYISPFGNFDFNVIIRSLYYNAASKRLSYQTGGAITYDSTAEQEWEEMRLKAWALERIFS